ncbi:hypothetical protein E3T55_01155 [Cryobacterium frigoriphilum]|uniref:Uncharacterized protein n=1 Tax=Cryobacterium frigoriphilum TaxID=1259150 RepID=A0A4R9ABC8_9MICO|nr:hypothetical protein [Cryobacterium frigoriphilum]TFD55445.1 hypothetical protein E3T55_01155 [Cryobacterium frigoriphilum]
MSEAGSEATPEGGYSLVELLVYMSFAVVVLTLIGGMLISTLAAERTISGRTGASTAGQIITQSIHAGVRNAVALETTQAPNGHLLRLANVGNAAVATPYCQAWFYDATPPGRVYYRRADVSAVPITVPTAAQLSSDGWLLLGSGIAPGTSVAAPWKVSGTPADTVRLELSVATDVGDAPAPFTATSTSRQDVTGLSTCFA